MTKRSKFRKPSNYRIFDGKKKQKKTVQFSPRTCAFPFKSVRVYNVSLSRRHGDNGDGIETREEEFLASVHRRSAEGLGPTRRGAYVDNLLIGASVFSSRDSSRTRLPPACNAFPRRGAPSFSSPRTLVYHFFVGPLLHFADFDIRAHARLLTSYYSEIPSRARGAANSPRIDNAKRISCQWGERERGKDGGREEEE